jgi:hypothetical protein
VGGLVGGIFCNGFKGGGVCVALKVVVVGRVKNEYNNYMVRMINNIGAIINLANLDGIPINYDDNKFSHPHQQTGSPT